MKFVLNEKTKIPFDGFLEKIHIWSTDENHKVLLILHGGPGVINRHRVLRLFGDLLDEYTLVAWDQRGTGGSYEGVDKSTLNAAQFVKDGGILAHYLTERFHRKVFLLGGSWGTELGTLMCRDYPEDIAGYIGFGQVVDGGENEMVSYRFTLEEAEKAKDQKAIEILRRVGPPVKGQYRGGFSGLLAQRKILNKYGGHNMKRLGYFRSTVWPILTSSELSLKDKIGVIKGYKLVLSESWPSVCDYDFRSMGLDLAMPYYIFQGRHDQNTPASLVDSFFQNVRAPKKELIWFENCAHGVAAEDPVRFQRLLREKFKDVDDSLRS